MPKITLVLQGNFSIQIERRKLVKKNVKVIKIESIFENQILMERQTNMYLCRLTNTSDSRVHFMNILVLVAHVDLTVEIIQVTKRFRPIQE